MDEIVTHDKSFYMNNHDEGLGLIADRDLSLTQKVALAARFLADRGHSRGLAGQISAKADSGSYWTPSYGRSLGEARASNLIRVNANLEVLEGRGIPNPANRFHSYIYRERPDVAAIVHTHAPHSSALAMIGHPLIASHMDSVALWGATAHLVRWRGVPFGDEEGRIISEALGQKRAVLLAHHGLLTVGKSIEEASTLAVIFEEAAELQLMAMGAGEIRELPEAEAREGHAFSLRHGYAAAQFDYLSRSVLKVDQSCLD